MFAAAKGATTAGVVDLDRLADRLTTMVALTALCPCSLNITSARTCARRPSRTAIALGAACYQGLGRSRFFEPVYTYAIFLPIYQQNPAGVYRKIL